MKAKRLILMLAAATALCFGANAQAYKSHTEQGKQVHVQKSQPGVKAIDKNDKVAHKQEMSHKEVAHKGTPAKGFRTTTAVKLRKHAANNSHSVKDKRGNSIVIPKGASIKYVGSKGNYYKVTYKNYTGYVAKKYTSGRAK